MKKPSQFFLVATCYLAVLWFGVLAQYGHAQSKTSQPPLSDLPFAVQLRKVVVLIETDCLHVPSPEEIAALSPQQREMWTPEGISKLTEKQLSGMKVEKWFGTGFIVLMRDSRLEAKYGANAGYRYLVTNHHVIEPGIETGHPCHVVRRLIGANHKRGTADESMELVPDDIHDDWVFPDDASVDLAAKGFTANPDDWDFMSFDDGIFVSDEELNSHKVAEGNAVLFAGLFIQYIGGKRLEPIVRTGSIAMLPRDAINTTLQKPGRVLLAELHSFGGNSGSPVFTEVHPDSHSLSFNYRFLGVVSGEVYETNDLTLQTTASFKGVLQANSNITMLVPAAEVRALLAKPHFVELRETETSKILNTK